MALTLYKQTAKDHLEQDVWPLWPLHTLLAVLLLGPIISPLFRATGLPFISDAGLLARDLLSTYVCPTPARSYMLLGLPMAVCARCWGATIGLWIARSLFTAVSSQQSAVGSGRHETRDARHSKLITQNSSLITLSAWFSVLAWPLRLIVCAIPFLLWPLEILGAAYGWWTAPLWLLLLNGAQAGFAAGCFFCSIWPGLRLRGA